MKSQKNISTIASAIEALLFIYGEPLAIKKIMVLLAIKEDVTREAIAVLKEKLAHVVNGLTLIEHNNALQLVTKPIWTDVVKQLVKRELHEELTPAALETLTIIAYGGPITKERIEEIRGVNSAISLRNLMLRGLIEYTSHATTPQYTMSNDCLAHLGINNQQALPAYEEYHQLTLRTGDVQ